MTPRPSSRPSRLARVGALAAIAGLVTSGCGADARADADDELRPVRIVLDWTPNTNHVGLYLALENGWFTEAGLVPEIIEPGEASGLQLVAAGQADVVYSVAEALVPAREKGADVVAVATVIRSNTSSLLALAEDGITRPRDLEGKRYGGYGGQLENALIDTLMRCDGADPDLLERVPMVSQDARADLEQDFYDTTWVFDGWDTVRMREVDDLDVTTIPFVEHTDCIPDWYTPLLAAGGERLESDHALIDDTIDVLARGYRAAMADPQAGADALLARVPELDRALVEPSARYLAEHFAPDAAGWGRQEEATWTAFVAFLEANELIAPGFDTAAAWTNELLD
ncbi:ABC transporter substrate-binding protein [Sanguibacter sp. A247]|uniref:ABC transporter substrate-binding protein n=1 Tax=unclassified Sanguibacter TaxID=2645534 RepID=UPI003FD84469